MLNWKQKIGAAITTAAMFSTVLAVSAFADTGVNVSGNGAFSDNHVNTTMSNSTNVNQSNTSNVMNDLTTVANTGGVSASFNTGGDVVVRTGDATANTTVNTQGGTNVAQVDGSGTGNTDVNVSGNGAFSDSNVGVRDNNNTSATQTNNSTVDNTIRTVANTGGVSANFNTGGDVTIQTGDANANTRVSTQGGTNALDLMGSNGGNGNGTNVQVSGNGAFSDNNVFADTSNRTNVRQTNRSNVMNDIINAANTGGVSASFNTGGDVQVQTGDANATTNVWTGGNSNVLDLNGLGGSNGSTDVWVSGNGAFSDNNVRVNSNNNVRLSQNNNSDVFNDINNIANTGGVVSGFGTNNFGFPFFLQNNNRFGVGNFNCNCGFNNFPTFVVQKHHPLSPIFLSSIDHNTSTCGVNNFSRLGFNQFNNLNRFFDLFGGFGFNTGGSNSFQTGNANASTSVMTGGSFNVL